jgi:hypothetical protein
LVVEAEVMKMRYRELLRRLALLSVRDPSEDSVLGCVQFVLRIVEEKFPRPTTPYVNYYRMQLKKHYADQYVHVELGGALDEIALGRCLEGAGCGEWRKKLIRTTECPQLIAGFRVRYRDWVWDTSVVGQLQRLTEVLR